MKDSPKILTIVIPTYNRDTMLDENMAAIKVLSDYFSFDLVVCDNASTDNTYDILKKWKMLIPNMRIIRHESNIYYDRNVASGYMQVNTDYCWLLGDSYSIDVPNFKLLIEALFNYHPLALIINDPKSSMGIQSKVYSDVNILLRELGWYITLLSSCIIRKDFINKERCERYYDSGFIHEGVFFDYLSVADSVNVYTLPSVHLSLINAGKEKKEATGWMRTPFLIFGKRWFSFVMSLPYIYSLDNKLYCILEHNKHQKIFSPWLLLKNKLRGYTSFVDYKESRAILKYVYDYPLLVTDLINILPSVPRLYYFIKKLKKISMRRVVNSKGIN